MLNAATFGYVGVVKTLINNKHIDVYSRDHDVSRDHNVSRAFLPYVHTCVPSYMYVGQEFNDADNSALIVLLHTVIISRSCVKGAQAT